MAAKVSGHAYCGVEEFREDFVLMCKNAMTYNAAETVYYAVASNVMKDGLKIIEKVCTLGIISENIECRPLNLLTFDLVFALLANVVH